MEWMMMKMQEDKATKLDCNVLKVKLPKLIIARFNGTLIDWFRLGTSSKVN